MPPRWSTPEKWKALEIQIAAGSTRHHAAWSHRTSVVLVTHPRKTYGRPALKNGGTAVLHIDERARFQAHYTIIADRDTGRHTDSRFATLNRAFRDQRRIVSEVVFVSRRSGMPIALFTGNRPALLPAKYWGPRVSCKTNEEGCANSVKSLQRSSPVLPISRSHG